MLTTHKVLIRKDDKYLVLLRPNNCRRYADCWDLPGGKSEEGEEYEQTIQREISEEISTEIELGEIIYHFSIDSDCAEGRQVHFYLHEGKLLDPESEIILSDEHIDYAWFTLPELMQIEKREIVLDNYLRSLS